MKNSKREVIHWWDKGGDKCGIHQDEEVTTNRIYYMWSKKVVSYQFV